MKYILKNDVPSVADICHFTDFIREQQNEKIKLTIHTQVLVNYV